MGAERVAAVAGQRRAAGAVAGTDSARQERLLRAQEANARLSEFYGPAPPLRRSDPLGGLVATILSQHTSDTNTERAFASLLARFGSFEAVRQAPTEEVEAAIRSGGLARIKARRLQRVLQQIVDDRGALSLDFLDGLELNEARRYLTALDGVGPKTAACVLLFNCGRPAIPVDTHVHRVSRRLGLIGARTSAAQAHDELEAIVPPDQAYQFHVNLIRHGRRICKAIRPLCETCPLVNRCPRTGLG